MRIASFSSLSDRSLLNELATRLQSERAETTNVIALLAEVDERRLYLPAGYASMYAYCVGHLFMSEDVAYKRLQVARATRKFPELLDAIAEGRLHVSAACMLCPYLGAKSAAGLIEAATHRSKSEIEHLLAERFPRPDMPTVLRTLETTIPATHLPRGRLAHSNRATPLGLNRGHPNLPRGRLARARSPRRRWHRPGSHPRSSRSRVSRRSRRAALRCR
jgi:hypothetical protein